jgi:hypothetical protein
VLVSEQFRRVVELVVVQVGSVGCRRDGGKGGTGGCLPVRISGFDRVDRHRRRDREFGSSLARAPAAAALALLRADGRL